MECLQQISWLANNIKCASSKAIKTFHLFVFKQDCNRRNRQRLREFTGFTFDEQSDDYEEHVAWAVDTFSGSELSAICSILKCDFEGKVEDVVARIMRCLMNSDELVKNDSEEETGDEQEADDDNVQEVEEAGNAVMNKPAAKCPMTISFRDVEDSIRQFKGDDSYPVESWLQDFEETATLFGWNDIQKVIFAKKSLRGLAKLFVQSEKKLITWKKLKSALLDEFSIKVNSADLHDMLASRRKKKEETVQEYLLVMREIASRGHIEPEALIQYVVSGIPDEPQNKVSLYEAKNLNELKKKLDVYVMIKKKSSESSSANRGPSKTAFSEQRDKFGGAQGSAASVPRKFECYNCNKPGHGVSSCPEPKRERGTCYRCGSSRHTIRNCPRRETPPAVDNIDE